MTHHYPSRGVRELDKIVKKYGWTWTLTKHGNVRWVGPEGQMVTTGSNPSWRSMKNAVASFHKAGVPRSNIPQSRRKREVGTSETR